MKDMPEGWKWLDLESILLLIRNGTSADQNKDNLGYPVTRIETISEGLINPAKIGYVQEKYNKISNYKLIPGDILFSHINSVEHIGKTAIYEGVPTELYQGMNLLLLRLNPKIAVPKYLLYYLKSSPIRKYFQTRCKKAVNQASINQKTIIKIRVPVPPLIAQKKIAAILDKAEETKRLRAQADEIAGKLIQSVFLEMFGDPVENPKGWKLATLESLCDEIYRYPTFYGFDYSENGIPVVRISNIHSDGMLDSDLSNYAFIAPEISKKFPRTILELNDILMAVRGDGSTAKRIGMVNHMAIVGSNISPNLIRFKTSGHMLNPFFFFYLLISKSGQKLLERYVTRTAKKTITATELKKIKIILPPLPLQQKFEVTVKRIRFIEQNQTCSYQEIDNLFNILMQKAFIGGLVA